MNRRRTYTIQWPKIKRTNGQAMVYRTPHLVTNVFNSTHSSYLANSQVTTSIH